MTSTPFAPFFHKLEVLNVSLADSYMANVHAKFAEHYSFWAAQTWTSNISIGGRLIPRSAVQDKDTPLCHLWLLSVISLVVVRGLHIPGHLSPFLEQYSASSTLRLKLTSGEILYLPSVNWTFNKSFYC